MSDASSNLVTGAAWNSPNDSPTHAAVAVLGDHFRHRGALRWTTVRAVAVQGPPPRVVLGPNGLGIWSRPGTPAWKANPANVGRVCDNGLWGWSRHPNYFFEWCVWIGFAVYCFAFGAWGLLGLVGQAIIVASIFGVTGIPPTENQAIRSKGDAYREYQKRVSRFIPMPPKSRGHEA